MKLKIIKSDQRGQADYGWLQARYSFSFANYYDPSRIQFGTLRVFNDDIIARGMGFGVHPHDNMEIITIPLEGSLKHRDSISDTWVPIHSGEVQVMSAGSGIKHAEMNNSTTESLNLFQIWVLPDTHNVTPRYNQKRFDSTQRKDKLQVLVSCMREPVEGSLTVYQDVLISRTDLSASSEFTYKLKGEGRGVFLMVINGDISVGGSVLFTRDAVELTDTESITIKAETEAELLWIEVSLR